MADLDEVLAAAASVAQAGQEAQSELTSWRERQDKADAQQDAEHKSMLRYREETAAETKRANDLYQQDLEHLAQHRAFVEADAKERTGLLRREVVALEVIAAALVELKR